MHRVLGTTWSEYPAPEATSDRGWLKVVCAPWDRANVLDYNSNNMPVWDEDIKGWREQSTVGNYLDYRPCRLHKPADKPQVHAICYASKTTGYFLTVAEAKQWIEAEAVRVRPELAA